MTQKKELKSVEEAIQSFEKLELGQDHAEPREAATSALDALRDEPSAKMFPPHLAAVSDAALRDFQMAVELMDRNDTDAALVELHGQALAGEYEELMTIVRSPRGLRLVVLSARSRATPMHRLETHAAAEERAVPKAANCFRRKIANQLFKAGQFIPHSEILSVVVPKLENRLEAARARHEAHASAEAERRAKELATRRESLAVRFIAMRGNGGLTYQIPSLSEGRHRFSATETARFIRERRCDSELDDLENQLRNAERVVGREAATA